MRWRDAHARSRRVPAHGCGRDGAASRSSARRRRRSHGDVGGAPGRARGRLTKRARTHSGSRPALPDWSEPLVLRVLPAAADRGMARARARRAPLARVARTSRRRACSPRAPTRRIVGGPFLVMEKARGTGMVTGSRAASALRPHAHARVAPRTSPRARSGRLRRDASARRRPRRPSLRARSAQARLDGLEPALALARDAAYRRHASWSSATATSSLARTSSCRTGACAA